MNEIKPPRDAFALRDSDRDSETWRRLKKHLEERLSFWRSQNDGEHVDANKTALIRGRIAMLKDLLALDKPNSPPASGSTAIRGS